MAQTDWDISCGPDLLLSSMYLILFSPAQPGPARPGKQELLYIWRWRLLTRAIHSHTVSVCWINQIYFKVKLPLSFLALLDPITCKNEPLYLYHQTLHSTVYSLHHNLNIKQFVFIHQETQPEAFMFSSPYKQQLYFSIEFQHLGKTVHK